MKIVGAAVGAHLIHSNLGGALEQDEALLQQAPVPHLWGDQVGLVAVSLLHDAPHILGVQDLVEVQRPDVVGQPLLEHLLTWLLWVRESKRKWRACQLQHILGVEELVEVQRPDVVGPPLLEHLLMSSG